MSKNRWLGFEGTHFDVGYQLGKYWVSRIQSLSGDPVGTKFLKKYNYIKWLNAPWNKEHEPLLGYFLEHFPHLVEELSGMVQGINECGGKIQTTFPTLFGLILGEVDEEVFGCSTIACRSGRETLLAHNEEDDKFRFPLCFARVSLKSERRNKEFLSVSHPFQLFGSSVGATPSFAFTGNSIKMDKQRTEGIRKSLRCRVPKTIFSRLMLEQDGIPAVKRLFGAHHSALPNHWFVVDTNNIWSAQLLPLACGCQSPKSQMNWVPVKDVIAFHTNHFQRLNRSHKTWSYYKGYQKESERRLRKLISLQASEKDCSAAGLRKVLLSLRGSSKSLEKNTAATILFKVQPKRVIGDADNYFSETIDVIEPCSIGSWRKTSG